MHLWSCSSCLASTNLRATSRTWWFAAVVTFLFFSERRQHLRLWIITTLLIDTFISWFFTHCNFLPLTLITLIGWYYLILVYQVKLI